MFRLYYNAKKFHKSSLFLNKNFYLALQRRVSQFFKAFAKLHTQTLTRNNEKCIVTARGKSKTCNLSRDKGNLT